MIPSRLGGYGGYSNSLYGQGPDEQIQAQPSRASQTANASRLMGGATNGQQGAMSMTNDGPQLNPLGGGNPYTAGKGVRPRGAATAGGGGGGGATPPAEGLLSGPGPAEDWYKQNQHAFDNPGATENFYSQFGDDWQDKSYSEQLYEQGMGQMDPHYNYAQGKATQNINDAMAARGGFNSGAAIQKIGDSAANLYGQQAMQMGSRAAQGDSERRSRYDQGMGFAKDNDSAYGTRLGSGAALHRDWQDTQENRLNTALDQQQETDRDKAHLTQTAFDQGGQAYSEGQKEALAAEMRAAGIDPTSQMWNDVMTGVATLGKAAAAG